MKKIIIAAALLLFLTGCAQPTFETLQDPGIQTDTPAAAQIQLTLPDEASAAVMESEDAGKMYFCDGYTVTVQTLPGGDLDRTLRQLTGFAKDALTLMQTRQDVIDRYESVWSAAGEEGDQVGRVVVLDDGNYHYAVSVMAPYTAAGDLASVWQNILESVSLHTAA